MDLDDLSAGKPGDPLIALIRQDLDPLSVHELRLRIEALEGEIARVRRRLDGAIDHRSSADALFKSSAEAPLKR